MNITTLLQNIYILQYLLQYLWLQYISAPNPATNQLPTYNDYIKSSPYASQERIGALSSSQVEIHDGGEEEEESPANADTPLNHNTTSWEHRLMLDYL